VPCQKIGEIEEVGLYKGQKQCLKGGTLQDLNMVKVLYCISIPYFHSWILLLMVQPSNHLHPFALFVSYYYLSFCAFIIFLANKLPSQGGNFVFYGHPTHSSIII